MFACPQCPKLILNLKKIKANKKKLVVYMFENHRNIPYYFLFEKKKTTEINKEKLFVLPILLKIALAIENVSV